MASFERQALPNVTAHSELAEPKEGRVGYIEQSLGDKETLHYRAHFPWFYKASAWAALIVSAVIALLTFEPNYIWASLIALIVGISIFAAIMVPIWSTEIGITNQRVIYKTGLVQRDTRDLQLRNVEEVRFNQNFWGRILGFGRLDIHGTGDDSILLPNLADPLGLRAALQEGIGNSQGDPPPVDGVERDPGMPELRGDRV